MNSIHAKLKIQELCAISHAKMAVHIRKYADVGPDMQKIRAGLTGKTAVSRATMSSNDGSEMGTEKPSENDFIKFWY